MPQLLITDFFKPKKRKLVRVSSLKPSSKIGKKMKVFDYHSPRDYCQSRQYLIKYRNGMDAASTLGGYFFCATNNFSEFSVCTTSNCLASVEGKEFFLPKGTFVAEATIDNEHALEHISVEPLFRRQGVGKNLIRFINKNVEHFHVYAGLENNSRYRLTEEGAKLISACHNAGILNDEQVILDYAPFSPSRN